jgi:AbrB family looped-hinge helix DNA binding protein
MKAIVVRIDKFGRIVIPKTVRNQLSLRAGDVLKLSTRGNALTLSPMAGSGHFIRKGNALVFSTEFGVKLTNEMVNKLMGRQ